MAFSRGHDNLYMLQLDWFLEEVWKMLNNKLSQEEVSDVLGCVDNEIASCERKAKMQTEKSIGDAWMKRADALRKLRSKLVLTP